jgi:hypothetical protein
MSSKSVCQVARSWVDVGSFHTRLFGVVYFAIASVREFLDTPSYIILFSFKAFIFSAPWTLVAVEDTPLAPYRPSATLFLLSTEVAGNTVFTRIICALFFPSLATEQSGCVKYADFWCGGVVLGFMLV